MATTAIAAEDLPDDVVEMIELLFQMPRIDASVGVWSVELLGVDGRFQRLYRKERVEPPPLKAEKVTWPIPPESP